MTTAERLAKALERAERDPAYWKDTAITDFTADLHARMKAFDISQGELARRLGTSSPVRHQASFGKQLHTPYHGETCDGS